MKTKPPSRSNISNNSIPLFVSILQKQKQLPECVQATLVRILLFEDDVKKDADVNIDNDIGARVRDQMRRAFRFEMERLLHSDSNNSDSNSSNGLDPTDRRVLMEYCQTETMASLFVSLLFSVQEIPDCLWKALCQNPTFLRAGSLVCRQVEITIDAWFNPRWCCNDQCHLDSDRDSHDQVETAIRFFPQSLVKWPGCTLTFNRDNNYNTSTVGDGLRTAVLEAAKDYDNSKSVSFVPLMAKLGLELKEDHLSDDRGGILSYDYDDGNTLRYIAGLHIMSWTTGTTETADPVLIDETNRDVMKELRAQNLLFKEDIQREDLMDCCLLSFNPPRVGGGYYNYFFAAEQRFRFLADWDPLSLARETKQKSNDGILPLHRSVLNFDNDKLQVLSATTAFRTVLELGIKHFPTKLGFLFHMDVSDQTPFEMACVKYGSEQVTRVVRDVLSSNNNGDGDGVYGDIDDRMAELESLVTLSVDETVHLEGVYFVLRRNPSIMARSLLSGAKGGTSSDHHPKRKRGIIVGDSRKTDGEENGGTTKRCL